MIWIYRFLFLPGLLIALPYYLRRMFKRGGYAKGFSHRFGSYPRIPKKDNSKKRIWIQAVSVGEVKAISPIITELAKNHQVFLTTTTSTGYTLAKTLYKDIATFTGVFPLDFWPFSARAWNKINPDLAILMESELWPEHLHQAKLRNTPTLLLNARLSDRSFRRYQTAKFLPKWILSHLTSIVASSAQDAKRYIQLGAKPEQVLPAGNLKFDVHPDKILSPEERITLKFSLGFTPNQTAPLILLGSSTWPGEEQLLINIFKEAKKEHLDCRLLLVPRHAERRKELESLLKSEKLHYHFRSIKHQAPQNTDVYIADTTGELPTLSQAADLAFIGKSTAPNKGGQTPIEAATLGLPILYGPNMSNFRQICQSLESEKAAIRCRTPEEITSQALKLLKDQNHRHLLGERAQAWHARNAGATKRTLSILSAFLND